MGITNITGRAVSGPATDVRQPPPGTGAAVTEKLRLAREEARRARPEGSKELRDFCLELDGLKDRLSHALSEPGAPPEWMALLATVRSSIPPAHASLGLAFTKALALAEDSAAKGDKANYQLGLRRLWTAFSMLQLTLSL